MGVWAFFRFGITEAPTAWARGPPSLGNHRGPHRMGVGPYFARGSPRPPPHGRVGLLGSGITEAPTAWARGPPSLRDY